MTFAAPPHVYRVPFTGEFRVAEASTAPPKDAEGKNDMRKRLADLTEELDELQRRFYAHDERALLIIFQAMDAAGKDSTIRAVMNGVDPAGCYVHGFKHPSQEELQHDFLWRTSLRLPRKGMIGIFNRSYYEEVLVVRVHPEFLRAQRLPEPDPSSDLWAHRLESIRDHERHLARNGTVILKFWLNVSRDEQRRRFLSRIEEADKHWKFNEEDVTERDHWNAYMQAYEQALNGTSQPWAPWYAIPADDKPYMRACVAEIIVDTLKRLNLDYPEQSPERLRRFQELKQRLENET